MFLVLASYEPKMSSRVVADVNNQHSWRLRMNPICTPACTCTHSHTCMHTHTHARTCVHTHVHTPMHMHAYAYLNSTTQHGHFISFPLPLSVFPLVRLQEMLFFPPLVWSLCIRCKAHWLRVVWQFHIFNAGGFLLFPSPYWCISRLGMSCVVAVTWHSEKATTL